MDLDMGMTDLDNTINNNSLDARSGQDERHMEIEEYYNDGQQGRDSKINRRKSLDNRKKANHILISARNTNGKN